MKEKERQKPEKKDNLGNVRKKNKNFFLNHR